MEGKAAFVSALGVGIGLGLGLSINRLPSSSSSSSSKEWSVCLEKELFRLLVDGKDCSVTFAEFPYYLSEQTKVLLTSAAHVQFNQSKLFKHTRNLSPAGQTILLTSPSEQYLQTLAKALTQHFEAKLLLLDVKDFSLKMQSKYGGSQEKEFLKTLSETTMDSLTRLFEDLSIVAPWENAKTSRLRRHKSVKVPSTIPKRSENFYKLRTKSASEYDLPSSASTASYPKSPNSLPFDVKIFARCLYKVLTVASKTSPVILYLRDIEMLMMRTPKLYDVLRKIIRKLAGRVLVLGSRTANPCNEQNFREMDEKLSLLFEYNIDIKLPNDVASLPSWNSPLEEDSKAIEYQDNRNRIFEILADNELECDDLSSICILDSALLNYRMEEIIVSAISHHLMTHKNPQYRNGRLVISSESLRQGLNIFESSRAENGDAPLVHNGDSSKDEMPLAAAKTDTKGGPADIETQGSSVADVPKNEPDLPKKETASSKTESDPAKDTCDAKTESDVPKESCTGSRSSKPDVAPDDEFEKRIRPDVIPAGEIGVNFSDVGALDHVKEALQELVMLPLRRPDLFRGGLLKPCRGILLFGPPGTGKTMLAKALATEANASFINVSMSTITSKWFGEDEKNVRALFSLASKVAPTVIFIDEVDSMLGQRSRAGEHEAMRKIKNEFMAHWDGLLSKSDEKVLVLAATNRPFDLDEAIIRRFERRIIVGLPHAESREKILRTLLAKEKLEEGFDFKELASVTEGYSGSDLRNLCTTAAFRRVRELLQKEKEQEMARNNIAEARTSDDAIAPVAVEPIVLRPLSMDDMRQAKQQVSASFAAEGTVMNELRQWNDLYGEGGSRKTNQLSYFL